MTSTDGPSDPWQSFRGIFAIDVRSLALFRIGLACILLYDLSVRFPDLAAHYSDAGVLTRAARRDMVFSFGSAWWLSPHMLSGDPWWQGLLLTIAAIAACFLLVGYCSRAALAVCWFLTLGLQARQPMVLQNCDVLLRCALFWSLFLPLGAVWSFDQRTSPAKAKRVLSFASAALLLQLLLMYVMTALLKTDPQWRRDGTALYYAIHLDHFTRPFGYWVATHPTLLRVMTWSSWLIEFAGPFLVLIPAANGFFRLLAIALFWGLHLGIWLCMDVGFFSPLCMLYWLLFLPSGAWDRAEAVLRRPRHWRKDGIEVSPQRIQKWLIIGLFLFVLTTNSLRRGLASYTQVFPDWLDAVGRVTGLDQRWNMFSPKAWEYGSWFIVEGTLADGARVNLWRPGAPIPDAKPVNVSAMYESVPWRRIMVTLKEYNERPHQQGVLEYFVRRWNEMHEVHQNVTNARIVLNKQRTPPPEASPDDTPLEQEVLARWTALP